MKKWYQLLLFLLALMLPLEGLAQSALDGADVQAVPMPQAQYIGIASQNLYVRVEQSREADSVGLINKGDKVYILQYDPSWLAVVYGNETNWKTGYVLRHAVWDVKAISDDVLPYGATPAVYACTLKRDTALRQSPDPDGEAINTLRAGTKLAILEIQDGWGKVIHWRQYGYFYLDDAEDMIPVYDLETAQKGDMISAFTSFFSTSEDGLNPNRIINIETACAYISIPMASEQDFSFNGTAGPYQKVRGYLPGLSFYQGETVPSTGGGTCQVSSTLYNVLLPVQEGMSILYRVAHGANGASYLPHGVDAACGNTTIDLRFRNDFPFPVRIEASAHHGALFIALLKDS